MNTNTIFVNKHIAKLPYKYAILSVNTMFRKTPKPSVKADLDNIDKQFLEFIKIPR